MVICLPWIFLKQTKNTSSWTLKGMCHFHLSFRFSLTFGSVFPHGKFTHGKPTAHPPGLTLCSSRAAGFGTLAKNSCSKVVRSNSTSCEVGFSFHKRWRTILEGRFDCFDPIVFFVWGPHLKPAFFFVDCGFVWGVQRWVIFHHLLKLTWMYRWKLGSMVKISGLCHPNIHLLEVGCNCHLLTFWDILALVVKWSLCITPITDKWRT